MALFENVRNRAERDGVAERRGAERRGIRASAMVMQLGNRKVLRRQFVARQDWQAEAWEGFDEIGEIKYPIRLGGNVMSKLRLFVGVKPLDNPEADPIPVLDEGSGVPEPLAIRASAELERLKSDLGGRAEIIRMLHMNLEVAGECYLVCTGARSNVEVDPLTHQEIVTITEEQWEIKSVDEIQQEGDRVKVIRFPGDKNGTELNEDNGDALIRIWARHPRFSYLPDNAMRGVLPIVESLVLLENQVKATAKSHMSAGILLIPQEFEQIYDEQNIPQGDGDDGGTITIPSFRQALDDALTEPVEDPSSAAAVAPLSLIGPNETLPNVRHLSFARTTDPGLDARIEGRVLRLARGLNFPVETVLGHQQTTFANAAQIDSDKFKEHYEPSAELMCDTLTIAFLQRNLLDAGEDPSVVDRLIVWYDPSGLLRGVDPIDTAQIGWQIGAVSDEAWRRVNGWTEDDAPSPVEQLLRAVMRLRSFDPGVSTAILELLGVPLDIPEQVPSGPVEDPNVPTPPDTEDTPTPPTQSIDHEPSNLAEALLMYLAAHRAGELPAPSVAKKVQAAATPEAIRAARRAHARPDYGRRLMEIDRELRSRLQIAATNALHRGIERAGAKLKTASNSALSKKRSSETSREMIRALHPRYVAMTMGETLVAATNLSTDDLMPRSTWDSVHHQWNEWVAAAQKDALNVISKVVPLSRQHRTHLTTQQERHRREAWVWLEDELDKLGQQRLYQPDGTLSPRGESDPTTGAVPVGLIRQSLARAGGATGLQPPTKVIKAAAEPTQVGDSIRTPPPIRAADTTGSTWVTLNNSDPTGGIATGELMSDALAEGGASSEAWVWDYGPAFRKYPFEEHEALDGIQFDTFDSDELDASGSWIDSPNYFPGDHDGCACDVVPVIVGPDETLFNEATGEGFYADQGASEDASGMLVPSGAATDEGEAVIPAAEVIDTAATWADPASDLFDGDRVLTAYQDDYSGGINERLRRGDESAPIVRGLDQMIGNQDPLEVERTAYRAFTEMTEESHPEIFTDGATFTDQGFVSTTWDRDIAASYAADVDGTVVEVVLPSGTYGYDYAALTDDEIQQEFLVGRGTTWEMERTPNGWRAVLTGQREP